MKKYLLVAISIIIIFTCSRVKADSEKNPATNLDSLLILVNKNYYLNEDYFPKDLVYIENNQISRPVYINKEVYEQYKKLKRVALKNNFDIQAFSGFRSYYYQQSIYVNSPYQALPGESEHQTGLALDISLLEIGLIPEMGDYPIYDFLLENAYKFGFILRYPEGKEDITGYHFEPWHYRYVGLKHAKAIYNQNITLEEYLNKA
ncbi:MAG: M15 family metallopeptidase [Erysipelotrichales bacterium]|nr:M15 family metallopeptidase [Erysipelotrichales bacterium]